MCVSGPEASDASAPHSVAETLPRLPGSRRCPLQTLRRQGSGQAPAGRGQGSYRQVADQSSVGSRTDAGGRLLNGWELGGMQSKLDSRLVAVL